MKNLEILDIIEILITQKLLKCPKDPFVRSAIICIYIDKIKVGIVTSHFTEICIRVMALYLRQNFVSAQYLENHSVEFHQSLYMH